MLAESRAGAHQVHADGVLRDAGLLGDLGVREIVEVTKNGYEAIVRGERGERVMDSGAFLGREQAGLRPGCRAVEAAQC
jgi:hypothetical protein